MESNYGYIIGIEPADNLWQEERFFSVTNVGLVKGYEGGQTESDENVIIIGDSTAFANWIIEIEGETLT